MKLSDGTGKVIGVAALAGVLAWGCGDPILLVPGTDATGGSGNELGGEEAGETSSNPSEPGVPKHVAIFDSSSAQGFGPAATGEGGAAPDLPLGPPYGTSTDCGDGIVGTDEECDDGGGGAPNEPDACTDECQTRDEAGGPGPTTQQPSTDRYLGAGRHPISGLGDNGFITTWG